MVDVNRRFAPDLSWERTGIGLHCSGLRVKGLGFGRNLGLSLWGVGVGVHGV